MSYPGGKAGAGVYQTIINEMPPHRLYVEAFAGGAAVLLRKKPAEYSIAIDADPRAASRLGGLLPYAGVTVLTGDARLIIAEMRDGRRLDGALIYCDPPYVRSTRRGKAAIYRHEFTDDDHRSLLSLLLTLPCAVMVSGYNCTLYESFLGQWRRIDFTAMTRRGPAIESLWMNFPSGPRHEFSYAGRNFRERERIKRKSARWRRRLLAMAAEDRGAVLSAMRDLLSSDAQMPPRVCRDPIACSGGEGLGDGSGLVVLERG